VNLCTLQDANGNASTTTSYLLVPGESVQIQQQMVGRKVEVTGMMIPAGEHHSETTTKTEREGAPDSSTTVKTRSKGAMAEFRVTSIRELGACN